ncbi:MAG: hypothetical protein LC623_01060 [Halobacteriales archaeon]|nr:hypothetical protein [Halobacteriales archaeon]
MSARPLLASLAVAALLAVPGSASTVEEATAHEVAYQFDGNTHHDAPDTCEAAVPEWSLPLDDTTDGILVAPDDGADAFVLNVTPERVGTRLEVRLATPQGTPGLNFTLYPPGCKGTILDPFNQPAHAPSPPAPGPSERQAGIENLNGTWTCNDAQWLFVVNQLRYLAPPATIHVAWTDGTERDVPLLDANDGTARYAAPDHLAVTVKGAWANLPAAWHGNFRIGAGPCDARDGGAIYGEPPVAGLGVLAFTPIRAGPHVVYVVYATPAGSPPPIPAPITVDVGPYLPFEPSDLVMDPNGTLDRFLANPVPHLPGLAVPATCHFCVRQAEDVVTTLSYRLATGAALRAVG